MRKLHSGIIRHLALIVSLCSFIFPVKANAGFWSDYREGYTAFHDAAKAGDTSKLQYYLEKGFDINKQSRAAKCTALGVAVRNRKYDAAKFLLEHGADPKIPYRLSSIYYTPLQTASRYGDLKTVKLLMNYIKHPDERMDEPDPRCHNSAFTWACRKGNLDVAEFLLSQNADINISNSPASGTPLIESAKYLQVESVRFLLVNGANPNLKDAHKNSAMDYIDSMSESNSTTLNLILRQELKRNPTAEDLQDGIRRSKAIKQLLEQKTEH